MEKMKSRDHPLSKLLPRPVAGTCNYRLRKNSEKFLLFNGSITCRTKGVDSFFAFRNFKKAFASDVIIIILVCKYLGI